MPPCLTVFSCQRRVFIAESEAQVSDRPRSETLDASSEIRPAHQQGAVSMHTRAHARAPADTHPRNHAHASERGRGSGGYYTITCCEARAQFCVLLLQRQTDKQTDRPDRRAHTRTHRHKDRQNRHTHRQTNGRADQTDKKAAAKTESSSWLRKLPCGRRLRRVMWPASVTAVAHSPGSGSGFLGYAVTVRSTDAA
jgi:hypothetical protein